MELLSDRALSGAVSAAVHRLTVRVYFEDTDAGGVAYHASYLRFFERARWELFALCGVDLVAALREGVGSYVVIDAHLRYHHPARLGDVLTIASRLAEIRGSTCVVQQKVMREGLLLVEGRIALAFVGPNGKPRRQPAAWVKAFEAVMGPTATGATSKA
ncbi:acyl-CoA thioester hydrolase [Sphingomonas vulcanisoli]|uniref:Acyl-CoA thioester hydrolase n=1 Tax=Sphingomonas vulcanisoli TaxID=1658060 RepID=A0ABX0TM17_9SPHN|nr:YbgC/FadM family acyl-CoA thioesterase [Sphingomonas vulcanisoli]NIJ06564.1 acyl-CoA thioester hydrolase [Sphingomonas vulcanisoli]